MKKRAEGGKNDGVCLSRSPRHKRVVVAQARPGSVNKKAKKALESEANLEMLSKNCSKARPLISKVLSR